MILQALQLLCTLPEPSGTDAGDGLRGVDGHAARRLRDGSLRFPKWSNRPKTHICLCFWALAHFSPFFARQSNEFPLGNVLWPGYHSVGVP